MSDPGYMTADEVREAESQPLYDPAEHKADEVLEYLATADKAEVERVYDAESAGKNRVTLLDKIAALPDADESEADEAETAEADESEPEPEPAKVVSDCVVKSDFHVGRAVNGKVCSYHAMHYKADGTPRE